ncbi:hypothetical protein PF004_g17702 [Phytophthora fragariae]|uniref:Uncharacterized protein n=1 Tax=Phytophthora fragariae TaxID=53985 RepID=A0A6A3J2P5_9STRA|nr:hypothetical protein PF003_g15591 [Phytophthora fragariae]KAE8989486.1 hypothetical protein PF011_g18754 [Phytophthora fragariae]KAE9204934.1 hypothetical protein PF004_g17702 [Phytophthora fragariae]
MGVASTVTQEHVDTVKQYVALRLEKRTKETLQLLEKTKVEGSWQPPAIEDGDDEHVVVRVVVKVFFVPISVKSTFAFDDDDRICSIHTSKA